MALAKTNPKVILENHLKNVAEISAMMCKKLTDNKEHIAVAYLAGLLHDIGKINESFQKHINGDNNGYALHNVAGYALFSNICEDIRIGGSSHKSEILNVILYHHPTNFKDDIKKVAKYINRDDINNAYNLIHDLLCHFEKEYKDKIDGNISFYLRELDDDIYDNIGSTPQITYLDKGDQKSFFIRNIVNPADIISSRYEKDNSHTIEEYFNMEMNRMYQEDIKFVKPDNYDDRFNKQLEFSKKLISSKSSINLFDSQTGFGKTMLGLMYLLSDTNRKGYWVCPTNDLAASIYRTIKKEIKALSLDTKIDVALLLTGEFIHGCEESDIIVTNIDNMFKPIMKSDNKLLYRSFQLLYGNCIFDEFHEYISEQAIMAAFSLICDTRKKYCINPESQSRLLLLSATSQPYFYERFIKNEEAKIFYDNDKMLDRKLHLIMKEEFSDDLRGKGYLFCTNTVRKCQDVMSNNIVDNIIHAQYLNSYKEQRYNELINTHGKNSTNYDSSWVSTSVASTGIDISFKNGVFNRITPDRFIQAVGRINRWGECKEIPTIIVINDKKNKSEKALLKSLSKNSNIDNFDFNEISNLFFAYMKEKLGEDVIITNRDLYNIRKKFYKEYKKLIEDCLKGINNESNNNLNKIGYSYSYSKKDEEDSDTIYISKKPSLRTDGVNEKCFVKFKDSITKDFIDELYQIDVSELDKSKDENKDDFWRVCLSESYKNKYAKEGLNNKDTITIRNVLINNAKCSDTPIMIVRNIFHDSILGILDKRK